MARHKFKSIEETGGLPVHLDNTKTVHRGLGYRVFNILVTAGVNTSNLARAFNVSRSTIEDWRKKNSKAIESDNKEVDSISHL